ncbi:MAG: hypothetical protein AB7K24_12755 [Gemmataceae bacterium]
MGSVQTGSVRPRPPIFRALGKLEPPAEVQIDGSTFRLERVMKHDSWAATALYESDTGEQVACKFQRQQGIGLLPMRWLGRALARHESGVYQRLEGLEGVPRLRGPVLVDGKPVDHVVAHDFVPGHPLKHGEPLPDGFFTELLWLIGEMHQRNVAYVDLHKRENILVGDDGRPYLFDFQISYRLPDNEVLAWLLFPILRLLQNSDSYHLQKHVIRCRPHGGEGEIARVRPWWISAYRLIAVPFRTMRRRVLALAKVRDRSGRAHSECFTEEGVKK